MASVRYFGEVQSTNLNKFHKFESDNLRSTRKNSAPLRVYWNEVDHEATVSMKQQKIKLVRFQDSLQVFTIPSRAICGPGALSSSIGHDSDRHISPKRSVRFRESVQVFLIPPRNEV